MAIKGSGPITINDVVVEFGGTAPHALNEYYKGGSNVPNTPTNSKIPTSGAISIGDFYGASKIIDLVYTLYGGGGTGGQGYANGSGTGSAGAGGKTGIMTRAAYDALLAANAGSLPTVIPDSSFLAFVAGGAGGTNGTQGTTGTAGGATDYGAGGAGGSSWSAGSPPTWGHWGAGGGGGGGDPAGGTDSSASSPVPTAAGGIGGNGEDQAMGYYGGGGGSSDGAGNGGAGGSAGGKATGTLNLTAGSYVLICGNAGTRATVGNFNGGIGNPGAIEFTLSSMQSQSYSHVPTGTASDAARLSRYILFMTLPKNGVPVFG